MSWSLFRWVWKLEAPLSIGVPPSGSLNRCRLYVPARNLWGALAAELAQRKTKDFPSYEEVGKEVKRDTRLTYLFPAEATDRGYLAWLPQYESGRGLVWRREDDPNGNSSFTDREMRSRLLLARPGTAVDHASVTAADGTLRETECFSQYWRDPTKGKVALVGYLFVREGSELAGALEQVGVLFVGGDTRYGLGRIWRLAWTPASDVFGDVVKLSGNEPSIRTDRVLAHTHTPVDGATIIGQLEALVGWDRAKDRGIEQLATAPLWAPGSLDRNNKVLWNINGDGLWRLGRDGV